jgi:Cu2+-containing amine oxidase
VQERGWRTGLKPLNVVQPEGPSFTVDGNMVSWQKWSMRVSFNYREGLVLHTVGSVSAPSLCSRIPTAHLQHNLFAA